MSGILEYWNIGVTKYQNIRLLEYLIKYIKIRVSLDQYSTIIQVILLMPKVTFTHSSGQDETEIEEGKTLLDAAQKCGAPMEFACGGNGFCTTCKCKVKKGAENLEPRTDREECMGLDEDDERLGCQAVVHGDVEVELDD